MENQPNNDLITLLRKANNVIGHAPTQGGRVRPGQLRILGMLAESETGEMTQSELLKALQVKAGSLSEILRKLERGGSIVRRRDPNDARSIIVTITESGHVIYREAEELRAAQEEELFAAFPAQKQEQLRELLEDLLDTWKQNPRLAIKQERGACWDSAARAGRGN